MIDALCDYKLLKLLPRINRARGWRVYDKQGNRFLDLSMDNSRAVLGYRPGLVNKYIKNALSKGVSSPYPSVYSFKLKQALRKWLPGLKSIAIFKDSYSLLRFLKEQMGMDASDIADPAFSDRVSSVSYLRPFLHVPDCEFLVPVFPVPGFVLPAVLCSFNDVSLPDDELANPVLLSAATRSIFDVMLEDSKKELWKQSLDCPDLFIERGPYLVFSKHFDNYDKVFRFFIDRGIILPVSQSIPGVFPGELSDGELKKLRKACREALDSF